MNPNTPPRPEAWPARPEGDLSSELAQRILRGARGRGEPVHRHARRPTPIWWRWRTASVYVRLSGGCQGCGLAKVTLSQGIEVALRDAVPEIESVVDVTDHASGANPFYEPAKK